MKKLLCLSVLSLALGSISLVGCKKKENVFKPKLDTNKRITLNAIGFFENFEAFDAITNDFNKYYPNIAFNYSQTGANKTIEYLQINEGTDLFMTSKEVFAIQKSQKINYCLDLSKEDINLKDIKNEMLDNNYVDGELLSIPMGQNVYGIVANVSLLEKEGLSIPSTYSEFISCLDSLLLKGYEAPIRGANSKVLPELLYNKMACFVEEDIFQDKDKAFNYIKGLYDLGDEFIAKGYISPSINKTFKEDNYDDAILKFFEGDFPFWVCNSEKVSGMKKRESKSASFKEKPFDYQYMFAPIGEKGAYVYREGWYGIAVNKKGNNVDYAKEFMRFLATKDEINKIADIKRIPSVAKETNELDVYKLIYNPKKIEKSYVDDGKFSNWRVNNWYSGLNKYTNGELTKDEGINLFLDCFK